MYMPLRESFEMQGHWLFRWRSYLPLVTLPLLIGGLLHWGASGHMHQGQTRPDRLQEFGYELSCLGVSIGGIVIRALAVGFAAPNTSGRNTRRQRADSLNTTGLYSVTRHPLYLGNFFVALGFCLFARTWWTAVIYVAAFWLYYERIMFAEEEFLRQRFGRRFEMWAARTPAFFPSFCRFRRPSRTFCLKRVIRNENPVIFLMVGVFAALDGFENYFVEGIYYVDSTWIVLVALSGTLWLLLRIIRGQFSSLKSWAQRHDS